MATQLLAPPIEGNLDEATIEEFRGRLRGPLLTPDDPGYDEARTVRNGLIDRRPALIARCSGTADVVACVTAGGTTRTQPDFARCILRLSHATRPVLAKTALCALTPPEL